MILTLAGVIFAFSGVAFREEATILAYTTGFAFGGGDLLFDVNGFGFTVV